MIQRRKSLLLKPPEGNPFAKTNNGWWQALNWGQRGKDEPAKDLETLQFAQQQKAY
ncbi:MAG: hypothetical protein U0X74_03040 [Anaerolineales bacterium]